MATKNSIRRKPKKADYGQNKIFPFQTQFRVLAVEMHKVTQNWEELCAKDFSQYDCPEDNQ